MIFTGLTKSMLLELDLKITCAVAIENLFHFVLVRFVCVSKMPVKVRVQFSDFRAFVSLSNSGF